MLPWTFRAEGRESWSSSSKPFFVAAMSSSSRTFGSQPPGRLIVEGPTRFAGGDTGATTISPEARVLTPRFDDPRRTATFSGSADVWGSNATQR